VLRKSLTRRREDEKFLKGERIDAFVRIGFGGTEGRAGKQIPRRC
jgi:hypothetical protein